MTDRKVLFVDGVNGASGDMILGALVDLGVPLAAVRRAVETLGLEGWTLRSTRKTVLGLSARRVHVRLRGAAEDEHGRTWSAVRRILRSGRLDPAVRDRAEAIFRRLFEAEAAVHGHPFERVHLHEAGAVDAIVDIVGAAVGLAHLAPDRIVVSPLTTGHGTVRCAHGLYPVPGPATLRLLDGVPLSGENAPGERLTPTGAAILTTVADAYGPMPAMRPERVGYGAGDHDFEDRPNALRIVLGHETTIGTGAGPAPADGTEIVVLECTVDDATPQVVAYALERLLDEGALDAFATPVVMKKGRPGHGITVLARPEDATRAEWVLLRETPTLGVRRRTETRTELEREVVEVATAFGTLRVKVGRLPDGTEKAWPEHEDCAAAARTHDVPLRTVEHAALEAARPRRGRGTPKAPRRPAKPRATKRRPSRRS